MKRFSYESFTEYSKIDKILKNLKIQTVLSAIKHNKAELENITKKVKTSKISDEILLYYKGCVDLSKKIQYLKTPHEFKVPEYSNLMNTSRENVLGLREKFEVFKEVNKEFSDLEFSIGKIQGKTEKASNFIAISITDIEKIIKLIEDVRILCKNEKIQLENLEKKSKNVEINIVKIKRMNSGIIETVDLKEELEKEEKIFMFKEECESKLVEIFSNLSISKNLILEKNQIIEKNIMKIKELLSEIEIKSQNLQESEIGLLEQDQNLNNFKNNIESKQRTKEVLREKYENSCMNLEDFQGDFARLVEKNDKINRKLNEKNIEKVIDI